MRACLCDFLYDVPCPNVSTCTCSVDPSGVTILCCVGIMHNSHPYVCSLCMHTEISSGRTVSCTSNSLGILPGRESVKTHDTTESLDIREACAHECILYSGIGTRDYCIHLYLPDRVSTVIAALRWRKESGMLTSSSLIRRYMYA